MRIRRETTAQVRKLGVEPRDVRGVIMTHRHIDHASAISDFAEATYVLGPGEWEAFTGRMPTLHGYVRKHAAHGEHDKVRPGSAEMIIPWVRMFIRAHPA